MTDRPGRAMANQSITDKNVSPEVSIVMPCLNEAETLAACIEKAQLYLNQNNIAGEIIIADNGSTDGSTSIAATMGVRVVHVAQKGYGSALMGGIAEARGKYIIMGDADDSYDFTSLAPFVQKLRDGCDLVMGNRFKGGIQPGAMPPLHRYFGNPLLTGLGRLFFASPCGDFHCGLRAFRKDAAIRMDLRSTGMEFASEMVVKATLGNMKIAEVPATLSPDGRSRPPHLRSWRDGWRHLRFMLLYSPRWLFLNPGSFLIGIGLLVGTVILRRPLIIGRVTFDVNTLLYCMASIVLGFQAIVFALFTKMFAVSERLHPKGSRVDNWQRHFTLERGLLIGALLMLAGLAGSTYAVSTWGAREFGPMDPIETLRLVIPSVLALIVGVETILSSFLLSILELSRK